jgi:hypothetical protein
MERTEWDRVRCALRSAPINPLTDRQHISYSFFNGEFIQLALEFSCSAKSARISPSGLLMVACDRKTYEALLCVWANVILMESYSARGYEHLRFLKQEFAERLLSFGFEVTVLDGDIVFRRDPLRLFFRALKKADMAFQLNLDRNSSINLVENMKKMPSVINIGVFSANPSEKT